MLHKFLREIMVWRKHMAGFSVPFCFFTALLLHTSGVEGGGKEIVVINGSQVYSFTSNEFELKQVETIDENMVYFLVDEFPVFQHPKSIKSFVEGRITYPQAALQNNIEGVVLVNFVVERDGTVSSPRILRSLGYGCDEEVLSVFRDFPVATPGKIAGTPVRVGITLPIRFQLKYN